MTELLTKKNLTLIPGKPVGAKEEPGGAEAVWGRTLARLADRVNEQSFTTWFKPLKPEGFENNSLLLIAPNSFIGEWITTHYLDILEEILSLESGLKVVPKIISKTETPSTKGALATLPVVRKRTGKRISKTLPIPKNNHGFTFERFVTGLNNKFAFAAAEAVAESPGKRYNPLFITASTGMGKTHLASAIAIKIHKKSPNHKITFLSCEAFVNDFINAMRTNKIDDFHYRYRLATDVLILEDIQFLSRKLQSQGEFFHTFNDLFQHYKQIVITADRFPDEMEDMDERLKTRFQSGVIADIHPPELETRVAILKQMSDSLNCRISSDVLFLIAEQADGSVRELEGFFKTVYAHSELLGRQVSAALVEEVALTLPSKRSKKLLSAEMIIKTVASYFGLKPKDLISERRNQGLIIPRYTAMHFCRELLGQSYPEIGRQFGGRDHRSVMNALKSLEKRCKSNKEIEKQIVDIEKTLNG